MGANLLAIRVQQLIRFMLSVCMCGIAVYAIGQEHTVKITFGKQGDRYAKFVCKKLKPFIDKNYRTDASRSSTLIAGSSAGGICAFRIAWENADIFSKAICMSPAFKFRNTDGRTNVNYSALFADVSNPDPTPFFYLDNGGIGLDKLLQPGIDDMLQAMKERGLKPGKDFEWKLFPEARHNEAAWASRFPAAIKQLLKK